MTSDPTTDDLARGRRHARTVTVGGTLVLLAPWLHSVLTGGAWHESLSSVTWTGAFLVLGSLLSSGHVWARGPVAVVLCLAALRWTFALAMAGGPALFVGSPTPITAQGAISSGVILASLVLANLANSRHLRAYADAKRESRVA